MTRIKKPPPITEAMFQRQVIELAKLMGWMVHHDRTVMERSGKWATPIQGDPGFPDLVLARNGRVLFVELKRERGKLTAEQQNWRWALGRVGRNAHIWYPSMWDSIVELLAKGE